MRILSLLFPEYCEGCGERLVAGERHLCALCREKHAPTRIVARPSHLVLRGSLAEGIEVRRLLSLYIYSPASPPAKLIQRMKYERMPSLGEEFGRMLAREFAATGELFEGDLLMPVPLHFTKLLRRGYNQAERICRGIGEATGIPVDADTLYARRSHSTQTRKTREQRASNIRGSFAARHPERLAGKHIILVDDVCTTGSTLLEAARTIAAAEPDVSFTMATVATVKTE